MVALPAFYAGKLNMGCSPEVPIQIWLERMSLDYKCEQEWQPLLPNGSLSLCNALGSSSTFHLKLFYQAFTRLYHFVSLSFRQYGNAAL